ncbi:hypothetical protein GCM10009847_11330 [Leucobacter tardus]|uniref:Cpe/LpqF family protein n=1 Tax=Leucobacter tardus TaxID=501483 RepID=A0A939QDT9_9MICO|nr:Cpe/LpqF family protein [Leucobacter tardus]MBO2989328.1 Cpe/LpqF family protein [Leucobacter tardus]
MKARRTLAIAGACAAVLISVGCSSMIPDETPEAVPVPDTVVGDRTQWVVDILNDDAETTEEEWEAALHPAFLEEVPASEFVGIVTENVRPARPYTVTDYAAGETQSVIRLESSSTDPVDMQLSIDAGGQITGLYFLAPED